MVENNVPSSAERNISPKGLKAQWGDIFEQSLRDIFEATRAKGLRLTPDQAMALLDYCIESAFTGSAATGAKEDSASLLHPPLRIDMVAVRRKAHRCAVDLFYSTYFPRKVGTEGKPRRGAPPLPMAYLDNILALRRKKWNYAQIAEKLGQPKDRMRKQVALAERRWNQAMEGIEEIKVRKQRTADQQSKRQTVKRRAGK